MNGEEKALTKKDLLEALGAMEQRIAALDGRLTALEQQFDAALEERLRKYVHDTETKLNTSLNRFSKSSHHRRGQLEDFSASATRRLAALEAATQWPLELRLAEIERKLDCRQ
jgi:hypothetical protein